MANVSLQADCFFPGAGIEFSSLLRGILFVAGTKINKIHKMLNI